MSIFHVARAQAEDSSPDSYHVGRRMKDMPHCTRISHGERLPGRGSAGHRQTAHCWSHWAELGLRTSLAVTLVLAFQDDVRCGFGPGMLYAPITQGRKVKVPEQRFPLA